MYYLSQGIIFGLYAAIMPGPMQAFIISQIFKIGWRRALKLAFIPLFSDGPIMLTLLLILSQLPTWFISALRIAGGFYILYLAWDAYHTAKINDNPITSPGQLNGNQNSFFNGVAMNLLNPNVYIFWSTIGVPNILAGWQQSALHGLAFLIGMYGTMIPSVMVWIATFGRVSLLKAETRKVIATLIAVLLLLIAINMVMSGVSNLTNGTRI